MATATKNLPAKVKAKSTAVATWQDRLAGMAKEATQQEASVASGQFIGTKAGQLTWNGQSVAGNKLDVVVLDSILENAYYPKKFDPDDPQPPVCFAFGRDDKTLTPHPDSVDKQHDSCEGCPMNEFGSADNGTGKGKACKNIRRLALISAKPLTEDSVSKGEVAYLKTPVTSVKNWAAYVRTLDALEHIPPLAVVTQIGSVPDAKSQFKLTFNKVENIDEDLTDALLARHDIVASEIDFPYPPPVEQKAASSKKPAGKRKY
jgi:hypothetical protein